MIPHDKCIGQCECTRCGHACSAHWYFNSEFIRCNHRSIPMIGQECQCNGLDRHNQPLLEDPYQKVKR